MFWPYFQTSAIHATVACGLVNATTIASLVLTPQFGYVSGPGVVGNLMASASLTLGISSELPVLKPPPRNFFIRRTNLSSLSSESLSGSSPPSPQSPFPFLTFFLSFLGRSGPIEGEGGGGGSLFPSSFPPRFPFHYRRPLRQVLLHLCCLDYGHSHDCLWEHHPHHTARYDQIVGLSFQHPELGVSC